MITLKGKFKGEKDYLRLHCLSLADFSVSKVPSQVWLSQMDQTQENNIQVLYLLYKE